jgi:selenocysteine lyase/cysteine desulfurase
VAITAQAQALWRPERVYLNTASFGLPPTPVLEALDAAHADWRAGRTSWEGWGDETEAARAAFARLCDVPADRVAVGSIVSALVGLVAAALPDGARVVIAEGEFTSLLFPFLVHADRGVEVVEVPVPRVAEAVDAGTTLVAVSAVQSATGEVADLHAIAAAAAHHGSSTLIDATQAVGWLPIDAGRFDAVVCGAYKWLCSPRGTSFMAVGEDFAERLRPLHAGWYAGESVHESYYGSPLRLARSARRFDVSPAWQAWIGTRPALETLEQIGINAINEHDVALANRFRAGLGLPPGNSAIVSAAVPRAAERLERARIMASTRAGSLRCSFHVYNTEADVDAALDALIG